MTKKYLNVGYKDKDLVKRLGGRWDASVKRWYCPEGSTLELIFRWRKPAVHAQEFAERASAPHAPMPEVEPFQLRLVS